MKILVAGTVPVLISGFGQYFFNWHGELSIFNGLIIWFQKPNQHLSGLFSNQNYTGCWLNIVWPFVLAIFLEKTNIFYKKGVSIVFLLSIARLIADLISFLSVTNSPYPPSPINISWKGISRKSVAKCDPLSNILSCC